MGHPKPNTPYTRTEIQAMCGGELQTYLPQRNKIILAGCFTLEKMNPGAPREIQVGRASKVIGKANLLSRQPDTRFPVFVKRRRVDTKYYFKGYFRFESISHSPAVIADAEARSGRQNELSCVIVLKPA
ncbi:hypothetical protein ACLIIZ_19565 [Azonexus caeni]|jgi:hypothetical protein|uniref:hypothetical protein n=1 Tax=Azonexus caeni TaxID=266126 RepID=UPI003A8B7756